ncbi:MAG: hypothetical protein ACTSU6_00920 [Candidatus Njordarchaeales archaeon]
MKEIGVFYRLTDVVKEYVRVELEALTNQTLSEKAKERYRTHVYDKIRKSETKLVDRKQQQGSKRIGFEVKDKNVEKLFTFIRNGDLEKKDISFFFASKKSNKLFVGKTNSKATTLDTLQQIGMEKFYISFKNMEERVVGLESRVSELEVGGQNIAFAKEGLDESLYSDTNKEK